MRLVVNPTLVDRHHWANFVKDHPQGTIFQTPEMCDIISQTRFHRPAFSAIVKDEGEIAGLILGAVYSERGGILGRLTTRCIVRGGPLYSDSADVPKLMSGFQKSLAGQAIYTNLQNMYDVRQSLDMAGLPDGDYHYEEALNFTFDLTQGVKGLWSNLHKTRKKQVKRAGTRGVDVQVLTSAPTLDYFNLISETYKNASLPVIDRSHFHAAANALEKIGGIRYFTATHEGKLIGIRIELLYKDSVMDWYAGSSEEAASLYPNDALVWAVLKWSAENGYQHFDFGGAGRPNVPYGVRDFKRKFGGQLVCYGLYHKINRPFLNSLLQSGKAIYLRAKAASKPAGGIVEPKNPESDEIDLINTANVSDK